MTFLLFFLLLHTQLADSLSFLTAPKDTNTSIYLPTQFECLVLHDSQILLTWIHNSQKFLCASGCPIMEGYSFSVISSSGSTFSTLRIDSVVLGDEGIISCKADRLSPNLTITASATLTVNDVLDFILTPDGVARNVGDSVVFYCVANKEGGIFDWKRSELTLPNNPRYSYSTTTLNSTLTVTGLTAIDMGGFVCEVTLSSEVITSPTAQLTLNDYSSPSVLQGYVYQVNLLIGPKTVSCPVEGYPLPTDITWTQAGLTIPTVKTEGPYSTVGVLQFDTSTESHSGLYSCLASNGIESANGSVTIEVTGLVGLLTRWYIIMSLCVVCIAVVCVTGAFLLSVLCCCVDRRKENQFRKRYDERIQQVKSRRADKARAMMERSEKTKTTEVSDYKVRATTQQAEYTSRHTTQFTDLSKNADGSVTYSVSQDKIQVGLRGDTRPKTVTEPVSPPGMRERPPTHLRLPRHAN